MIKILLNTILGIVLIIIWSRFVDLPQIWQTISKVNLLNLFPVFFFMFLSPFLRAIRLKVLLSDIKKISLKDLFFLNGVAMMLNFFIPIRAGELAKGVYLNTKYDLNLGKSIIWIFIDRFVDFLVVLLVSALLFFVVPTSLNITFITIIIIILFIGLILTYLAVFNIEFSKKMVSFLRPLLIVTHIKIYFERFSHFILDSFAVLRRHPKDLVFITLITILAYGADAGIWYFIFVALGQTQPFLTMYLGQLLSALAYLIPAAPGYIGSAEASGLLILSGIFGLEANFASAMTVLFHILSAIFIIIYGLMSIFNLKINLGAILSKALKRS